MMSKKYIIISPILLILLWAIVSQLQLVDKFFLPDPLTTLTQLIELIKSGIIIDDVFSTLGRVAISFAIAVVIGLPLGLWLGSSEKIYRSFEFVIDFFRSTPATALFPLFLLVFGITDKSKIAVAAFASMLIIIFNTAYGVMHDKNTDFSLDSILGKFTSNIHRFTECD